MRCHLRRRPVETQDMADVRAVQAGKLTVTVRFACEKPGQNSNGPVGLEAQVDGRCLHQLTDAALLLRILCC